MLVLDNKLFPIRVPRFLFADPLYMPFFCNLMIPKMSLPDFCIMLRSSLLVYGSVDASVSIVLRGSH